VLFTGKAPRGYEANIRKVKAHKLQSKVSSGRSGDQVPMDELWVCYVRREFGRQYHFLGVVLECFGCGTERPVEGGQWERLTGQTLHTWAYRACGWRRKECYRQQCRNCRSEARLATKRCQSEAVRVRGGRMSRQGNGEWAEKAGGLRCSLVALF
jgi:hypothetical protein